MACFTRADRQRIVDGYLAQSGSNMFVPGEFVDWLAGQPEHEAYEWFFGSGDEAAARAHRLLLARQLVNGLRITARVSTAPETASVVSVAVREFPAMVSPMAERKDGGGYVVFDSQDPASVAELRRQGAAALRSWLARYRGVAELSGLDVSPIEEIAADLDGRVAGAA